MLAIVAACSTLPRGDATPPPVPSSAAVESAPANPAAGTAATPVTNDDIDAQVEAASRAVRGSAEWLARGVDSWFGDKPFAPSGGVSSGIFSVGLQYRQREGTKLRVRFNARFRLPNVERFGYVFIGRDDPNEVVTDTPDELSRRERVTALGEDDRSFFAGLGVNLRRFLDFRIGLRRRSKPYLQLRYLRPWRLGPRDRIELLETVFWVLDDRFGTTTALKYEHLLNPTLALRWVSAVTAAQRDHKFDWSSSIGAYQSLGEDRLVSVAAVISGRQQRPAVTAGEYGLVAKWEHPLRRKRLLGELSVGRYRWRRTDVLSERGRSWAVGYALKLRF